VPRYAAEVCRGAPCAEVCRGVPPPRCAAAAVCRGSGERAERPPV